MKASLLKLSILLFLLVSIKAIGTSQKEITVEDIWSNRTFATKSVPGFNFMKDGRHYTRLEDNVIKMYDLTTGNFIENILEGNSLQASDGFEGIIGNYTFSDDEKRILLKSESEQIYRRSSKAKYHVYDRKLKKAASVFKDGKIVNATFSPDGKSVGYTRENDLYAFDIASGKSTRITTDGAKNEIINGMSDWVYEEEFSFTKAFFWSPDSKNIAFIRFDEREVPEITMTQHHDELYPEYVTFKYPKVGMKNAKVSVHIYNLSKSKTTSVDLGDMTEMYVPRVKWTDDPEQLCVYKMNRHQNHLQLHLSDTKGKTRMMYEEKNKYYIDITDDVRFLKDGKGFIWTSEKSGFNHIYLNDMNGNEIRPITSGNFDVTNFYGFDEKNEKLFYQSVESSPLEKQIYSIDIEAKQKKLLTPYKGTNKAQFSSTFDYFVNNYSNINTASKYIVYDCKGKEIRRIETNEASKKIQKEYNTQEATFFEFTTSQDVTLNGWMILPSGFDKTRKYPVFMTQYSGPGSQSVSDAWKGNNYWWYQLLAQQGVIVACVDGRGTGGRGEEFKKMTYLQLGHYETIDQIEAAKYLGGLPYTDASRIGIFGWSYGGYMSSLCILKGNDVFKAAIAVAPVTSWKWYDTIYTERYMRTLSENEDGYRDNSPIYFADRLKGDYLLVHGDGDDNVHFQNTVEMTRALISANKQFDTYFYPNRNHGIYGDNARQHLYDKMTDFLMDSLSPEGSLRP